MTKFEQLRWVELHIHHLLRRRHGYLYDSHYTHRDLFMTDLRLLLPSDFDPDDFIYDYPNIRSSPPKYGVRP
jgi:hypothetical protein